jgi:hypothetical protein
MLLFETDLKKIVPVRTEPNKEKTGVDSGKLRSLVFKKTELTNLPAQKQDKQKQ